MDTQQTYNAPSLVQK